jgi:hypothetical protein
MHPHYKYLAINLVLMGICTFVACQRSVDVPASDNARRKEPPKTIRDPIVFARLKGGALASSPLPNLALGHCAKSEIFQAGDLCGPMPQKTNDQSTKGWKEAAFFLSETPIAFFWQQSLSSRKTLQVEVIGDGGLPLPTKVISLKQHDLLTIQIIPKEPLPEDETLYLRGTIFEDGLAKKQTWLLRIVINHDVS